MKNILERARNRQKKLQELRTSEKTPLKESNSNIRDAQNFDVRSSQNSFLESPQNINCGSSKNSVLGSPRKASNHSNINLQSLGKVSSSQPNLTDIKSSVGRKEIVSDPNVYGKSSKENSEGNFIRQNSTTISSNIPGSPSPQLKTFNIKKDDINMEIKLFSSEEVRLEVEIAEKSSSEGEEGENEAEERSNCPKKNIISQQAKNKLQRLGKLYSGGEDANLSSPIHRSDDKFLLENEEKEQENNKSRKGLNKLADLAKNINNWEDESQKVRTSFFFINLKINLYS